MWYIRRILVQVSHSTWNVLFFILLSRLSRVPLTPSPSLSIIEHSPLLMHANSFLLSFYIPHLSYTDDISHSKCLQKMQLKPNDGEGTWRLLHLASGGCGVARSSPHRWTCDGFTIEGAQSLKECAKWGRAAWNGKQQSRREDEDEFTRLTTSIRKVKSDETGGAPFFHHFSPVRTSVGWTFTANLQVFESTLESS